MARVAAEGGLPRGGGIRGIRTTAVLVFSHDIVRFCTPDLRLRVLELVQDIGPLEVPERWGGHTNRHTTVRLS